MHIGTIGTGFIVDTFLQAVALNDGVDVTAMYTRKKENARKLATTYNISKIYTSIEDLLQDDTLDFIYVASPNSLHYEQTLQALQAGKHVICEKPFTSTVEQLEHLISIAKEKQLFLFEAITTVHLPNFKKIKDYIKEIGPIKIIQCNFSKYSTRYDALLSGQTPNIFNPDFSGGALSDLNIYNLHFVIRLFGNPKTVHYFANKHNNGIDTSGIAILQYDTFIAECVAAKDSTSNSLVQIQGEKGCLIVNGPASTCPNIEIHTEDIQETCNLQEITNGLYYEISDFKDMYNNNEYATCYQLLKHSQQVLQTTVALRKDAAIIFPHDTKY